jgi:pyruvate dehydrogenase E1 component
MYVQNEDGFYYLTVGNDKYLMPPMPSHVTEDAIIKGLYKFRAAPAPGTVRAHLWGSGAILNEALKAQELLAGYGVAADVWSVTSYNELYRDAMACDRHNMLHPGGPSRTPYAVQCMTGEDGVIVAASDYVATLPDSLAKWLPLPLVSLGTDGFGLSEDRAHLRNHFEVDARFITLGALSALGRANKVPAKTVQQAIKDLDIDAAKSSSMTYQGRPGVKRKE